MQVSMMRYLFIKDQRTNEAMNQWPNELKKHRTSRFQVLFGIKLTKRGICLENIGNGYLFPAQSCLPPRLCLSVYSDCLSHNNKTSQCWRKKDNIIWNLFCDSQGIINTWAIFINFYCGISGVEMYALFTDDYLSYVI